jgi:hypothetical protein
MMNKMKDGQEGMGMKKGGMAKKKGYAKGWHGSCWCI